MNKNYPKILSLLLAAVLCIGTLTIPASAVTFTDVPGDAWFHDAVMGCAGKGYVSGVGNDQFMPDGKLTYAQIFTMFTNAFYKSEKQSYEDGRRAEMDAYFGGEPEWWSYNAYYLKDNGLIENVSVNIQISVSANSPITRYDVVQFANNILKDKGITVSEAQKAEAQAKIDDYKYIPGLYKDAVASCYYLGIISGYTSGGFGGNDTLTRAQACVILDQLEKVIVSGPQSGDSGGSSGDSSSSGDNSSGGTSTDGVLANGKPITEKNVLELLAEIEKKYPTGTLWCASYEDPNTNYNPNKVSDTLSKIFLDEIFVSDKYACGGFAAMVSDLVFGYGNPARKLDDLSLIRPGDIIVELDGTTTKHVMIATSRVVTPAYNGVFVADGNNNDKIEWNDPDEWNNYITPTNSYDATSWVVYTRYPD